MRWHRAVVAGVAAVLLSTSGCSESPAQRTPQPGYRVVRAVPHDAEAFTEGLVIVDGTLFESTGQFGSGPSIRQIDLATGRVVKQVAMPEGIYSEGLTFLAGRFYQLTLQNHLVTLYDIRLNRVGQRRYDGEAWGLTKTGEHLVLSDGTSTLSVLDPSSFHVVRRVAVTDNGAPVAGLNELERVGDEVLANVFRSSRIARIDLATGHVRSWVDLSALVQAAGATDEEAVLNGIAVDPATGHLYVTGKLWPKMFEIELTGPVD